MNYSSAWNATKEPRKVHFIPLNLTSFLLEWWINGYSRTKQFILCARFNVFGLAIVETSACLPKVRAKENVCAVLPWFYRLLMILIPFLMILQTNSTKIQHKQVKNDIEKSSLRNWSHALFALNSQINVMNV